MNLNESQSLSRLVLRAEYVAALETLPPEHPAQLVRTRIGMSFDQLTVAAADKSKQDKVA